MWCLYQKMEGSSLNTVQQKQKPTNYIAIHNIHMNVYSTSSRIFPSLALRLLTTVSVDLGASVIA